MQASGESVSQENSLVFKDIHWIMATGGLYNGAQVLEYFYRSPFYDKFSNNEELRMQGGNISVISFSAGDFLHHKLSSTRP